MGGETATSLNPVLKEQYGSGRSRIVTRMLRRGQGGKKGLVDQVDEPRLVKNRGKA